MGLAQVTVMDFTDTQQQKSEVRIKNKKTDPYRKLLIKLIINAFSEHFKLYNAQNNKLSIIKKWEISTDALDFLVNILERKKNNKFIKKMKLQLRNVSYFSQKTVTYNESFVKTGSDFMESDWNSAKAY